MARHDIPDDGVKHLAAPDCPCRPTARKGSDRGVFRTVYTHAEAPSAVPAGPDQDGGAGSGD